MANKNVRSTRMRKRTAAVISVAAIFTFFSMCAWALMYLSVPAEGTQSFEINANETSHSIVQKLKSEGIIRSTTLFDLNLLLFGRDLQFQLGVHDLTGAANYREIIRRLTAVDPSGENSLVDISNEPTGLHCAYGGQKVESGIDKNSDDTLQSDEVTLTNYLCDGLVWSPSVAFPETGIVGVKNLVNISNEPTGLHCAYGGKRVDSGIDTDNSNTLEPVEVTATSYVCNGAAGAVGATGAQGGAGETGSQGATGAAGASGATGAQGTTGTTGAAGAAGATGSQGTAGATGSQGTAGATGSSGSTGAAGSQGESGDTGAAGATGTQGESGAQGIAGATGEAGTAGETGATGSTGATGAKSLVNVSSEPAGANCTNGGIKMDSGIDTNNDSVLNPTEVTATSYVCNGAAGSTGEAGTAGETGATGSTGATGAKSLVNVSSEPAGANCTNGGIKMENGIDTNNDDVLNPTEVTATSYVCNGTAGAAGSSGSTRVTGTTVTSAPGAAKGVQVIGTATCAAGKVLLGGGALVTTTDTNLARAVLVSSYPSSTTTYTAIGVVGDSNLSGGSTLSVTAYALCSL